MTKNTNWENIKRLDSSEGNVSKFVYTKSNAVAESVLYKYPNYQSRTVICCSTQSGCPVGCRFCGAGDNFVRSLNSDEIVEQVVYLLEKQIDCNPHDIKKLQIMFMSMGEPMLNQNHLFKALRELNSLYPHAALLISTSGPKVSFDNFHQISKEIPQIGLQFSVHESTDEKRNLLIPFQKKMNLKEIAQVGETWFNETGRKPFFNYCAHEKNSSIEDAIRLSQIFNPEIWEATISVICERDETLSVAHDRQKESVDTFMTEMLKLGYSTRKFDPAGQDDIGGGCGQLPHVQKWFKENPHMAKPSIGSTLPIIHAVQGERK